jgi:beta-phosphoglucomutase-like phosphatase (HAD superfamily)
VSHAAAPALRAALVEPDGVLFELRPHRAGALREACAAEGMPLDAVAAATLGRAAALPADAAVRAVVAAAAAAGSAAARACDDVALALLAHRAERAFGERLARGGVALRDGAREAVEALGARLRLGIVTRLRRADVELLLAAAGVGAGFAVIVAADDRPGAAPPGRGPGAPWTTALVRLAGRVPGLTPAQAVALVDAAAVDGARAAGLRHRGWSDDPGASPGPSPADGAGRARSCAAAGTRADRREGARRPGARRPAGPTCALTRCAA